MEVYRVIVKAGEAGFQEVIVEADGYKEASDNAWIIVGARCNIDVYGKRGKKGGKLKGMNNMHCGTLSKKNIAILEGLQ